VEVYARVRRAVQVNPGDPARHRLARPGRDRHRHHPAAQPRSPQQVHHRPPHPRRVHHQPAAPGQFLRPRHLRHPLHHLRIRSSSRHLLQVPQPQPRHFPPRVYRRVPLPRQLRALQHRRGRVVSRLPQVQPQEISLPHPRVPRLPILGFASPARLYPTLNLSPVSAPPLFHVEPVITQPVLRSPPGAFRELLAPP
jgi:hypothetical protein